MRVREYGRETMKASSLVLGLALALLMPPAAITVAEGDEGPGDEGRDGGRDGNGSSGQGRDGDSGGSADENEGDGDGNDADDRSGRDGDEDDDRSGPGPGRNISALAREHAEERKNFSEEQREERDTFEDAQHDARDACRDENLTEEQEEDCEEALKEGREAFRDGQHEAREAFEESLRAEFRAEVDREADEPEERAGHFNVSGGGVSGKWVSFGFDAANATITNVTVSGQLLLDSIAISGAGALEELKVEGANFKLEFENGEVKLHDNPALALKVEAEDGATGTVDVADYLNVTRANASDDEDAKERFAITDGANLTATLKAEEGSLGDGNAITFDDEAKLVVHGPNEMLDDAGNRHRGEIENAKKHGKVGAEVTVLQARGIVLDVVALENVTVNFTRDEGTLRFEVGASGIPGKVFVINVERELLRADQLIIRYFDEVNGAFVEVPIVQSRDIADCLDATDDSTPEYCIVKGADGWQVIVSVNNFSVHAFTIEGAGLPLVESVPTAVAGALAAVAFASVAALGLFRKRRKA